MATARLTKFLVELLTSKDKLTQFQDINARKKMVDDFPTKLVKPDEDAMKDLEVGLLTKRIRGQQGGTGHARVKEANRLAAKAKKAARKQGKKR
jgi:hypothetical protein